MSTPQHVTDDQFEQEVLRADMPVVVDFWAPWCAPCKQIAPFLEELAREKADTLKVVKVNVDDCPRRPRRITYVVSRLDVVSWWLFGCHKSGRTTQVDARRGGWIHLLPQRLDKTSWARYSEPHTSI